MKLIGTKGRRYRDGFTLIELFVVLVVIAILIALILPRAQGIRAVSNIVRSESDVLSILDLYEDGELSAEDEAILKANGFICPNGNLQKNGYQFEVVCPDGTRDCFLLVSPVFPGRTGDDILEVDLLTGEILDIYESPEAQAGRARMFDEVWEIALDWLDETAGYEMDRVTEIRIRRVWRWLWVFDQFDENGDRRLTFDELERGSLSLDDSVLEFSDLLAPMKLGEGGEVVEALPGIRKRDLR